jgi:hypothetical protein
MEKNSENANIDNENSGVDETSQLIARNKEGDDSVLEENKGGPDLAENAHIAVIEESQALFSGEKHESGTSLEKNEELENVVSHHVVGSHIKAESKEESKKEEHKKETKKELDDHIVDEYIKLKSWIVIVISNEIERKKKGLTVSIDGDVVDILQTIMDKNKDYFDDVAKTINEIIKDNSVDLNDIPELLLLFKKTYTVLLSINMKRMSKEEIIKLSSKILLSVIIILVKKQCIKVKDETKFIDNMQAILETCIILSKHKNVQKTANTIFSCIQTILLGKKSNK